MKQEIKRNYPSSKAVQKSTGKKWEEWFAIIDSLGKGMEHKDIASYLHKEFQVTGWWSQMITVTYEKEKGLRENYQRADGYSVSVSKVIGAPISTVYRQCENKEAQDKWLSKYDGKLIIRRSTPNKSMRMTWVDGKSNLEVNFYVRGESKSQIVVQHNRLSDKKQADKMKLYWKDSLERLSQSLKS
jgi:hypothetical protein